MINYLIVLFAITLMYFSSADRLITYVKLIALQGLLALRHCHIRAEGGEHSQTCCSLLRKH